MSFPMTRPGADINPAADRGSIASTTSNAGQITSLLAGATASGTGWRLAEIWTDQHLPFEVLLAWTGAKGAGQQARFSSEGGAIRFCFAGMGIAEVRVQNRSDTDQSVSVAVASLPGPITTSNHYMTSERDDGAGIEVAVPPYATTLKILTTSAALAAATTVEMFDGNNALCAAFLLTAQAPSGEFVSGVRRVRISGAPGARYKIDFALGV